MAQSAAPIVLNPDAPRVGISRYRVTVAVDPGEEAAAVVRDVAALVRARPEPYAAEGFTGFVATLSDARLGLLARDRRVVLIEELGLGIQPRQQPSLAPAAPQRPPVATAQASVPRPQRSLSPAALWTGSTWSIGPYAYDGSGNIRAIGTDTFEYDAFGRLVTSHAAGQKQTFQYDRFGNLTRITTNDQPVGEIRPCVDPATNRLVEPPPGSDCNATGSHDAAGNVLTQDLDTFRYDALGMLSGAWIAGVHVVPLYTPSDERVATMRYALDTPTGQWTVHLGTEWTVRDAAGRVLRRFTETPTGTWSWTEDYVYLGDRLLAAEVATPEKTLHFFPDHLGTPRLITGNGGAKVAEHVYSAFGVEITSELQDAERMKFTGHERDASSLDHMHARAYRPNLGRFLSVDPGRDWDLRQPQSWNMYSYVRNNPIYLTDPTGRSVVGKIIKLGVKGFKVVRKGVARDELVKAARAGDDVLARSRSEARELAKRAGDGKHPMHDAPHGPAQEGFRGHYHAAGRPDGVGHFFYGLAGALTLSYYAEDKGAFVEQGAAILDLVNPFSTPQDVIDISEELAALIEGDEPEQPNDGKEPKKPKEPCTKGAGQETSTPCS